MNRLQLRERVRAEFGPNLERITPAGAREFLENLYREFHQETFPLGRVEINESAGSYEQVMCEFFSSALEMPTEQAVIILWLWAFEQHFTTLQEEYAERFLNLFGKNVIELEDGSDDTEG
jgi:hypothetical protein